MAKPTQKPARKNVGSPFENSIQSNLKKNQKKSQPNVIFKYVSLDKRQFYHSHTNRDFSVKNNKSDITDSEDEGEKADIELHRRMVNSKHNLRVEEKATVNLWNQFVQKRHPLNVKHMKNMCKVFIDMHISEIRQQQLYRDVLLHLCTLHHGHLLSQKDFFAVVEHLHVHMGILPVKNQNDLQSDGKENALKRKREHSKSPKSAAKVKPQPKRQATQRMHLRMRNLIE